MLVPVKSVREINGFTKLEYVLELADQLSNGFSIENPFGTKITAIIHTEARSQMVQFVLWFDEKTAKSGTK
jgi:hypothetical protein